jgi:uncharacterized membrane protein (DUF2068 family)
MDRALRLIVAWKFGRAVLSLGAGLVLLIVLLGGLDARVQAFAAMLQSHAVSALSLGVSRLVQSALEPAHLEVVTAALILDGLMVLIEGVALLRGWRWGPWLVIAVTGVLLPFEVYELIERLSVTRVAVLAVNVAIVAWLLRRQRQGPQR